MTFLFEICHGLRKPYGGGTGCAGRPTEVVMMGRSESRDC